VSCEREILPVLWQDNYFYLLPAERRDIDSTYETPKQVQPGKYWRQKDGTPTEAERMTNYEE
jgi:hypothetical protein